MIETRVNTTPQRNLVERAEEALAQLVADASRRGFYGEAALTLSVQDYWLSAGFLTDSP